MAGFQLRAAAKRDLIGIATYTESRWGRDQRNHYLKQLDDAFQQLGENSALGPTCDYVRPGYRKFPTGSHVIYYRIQSAEIVEVVRIIHKSMDVSKALFEA